MRIFNDLIVHNSGLSNELSNLSEERVMALATCRECGRDVSTQAVTCPACGVPEPTRAPAASGPSRAAPATSPFRKPSDPAFKTPIEREQRPPTTTRAAPKQGGRKLTFVHVLWGGLG